MFGVDAPALIQLIKEELKKETLVLEGKEERKSVKMIWFRPRLRNFFFLLAELSIMLVQFPFNELTEAERKREEIITRKNELKEELYKQKLGENKFSWAAIWEWSNVTIVMSTCCYFLSGESEYYSRTFSAPIGQNTSESFLHNIFSAYDFNRWKLRRGAENDVP